MAVGVSFGISNEIGGAKCASRLIHPTGSVICITQLLPRVTLYFTLAIAYRGASMIEARDLILKEIEIVHSEIARFDNNGLKVKEWCLGVWAALIAYGVQHSEPLIVAGALVTTIIFSSVELTYRRYQLRFIARSRRIEQLLTAGQDFQSFQRQWLKVPRSGRLFENPAKEYRFDIHFSAVGQRDPSTFWDELPKVLRLHHFTIFYFILAALAYVCTAYVYLRSA
jgi:hypothetical protein